MISDGSKKIEKNLPVQISGPLVSTRTARKLFGIRKVAPAAGGQLGMTTMCISINAKQVSG
jgi:hypothetical protein